MKVNARRATVILAICFALPSLGNNGCGGNVIVVNDGESIQDAVDAASPGDTIVVRNGFYTATSGDAVVTVLKNDIKLIGNPNAVIDATGLRWGVKVGDDAGGTNCQTASVSNFTIEGFTIQNADRTGLYLTNVDGYSATGGVYLDNEEYGPYPVCSTNGRVAFNYAARHNDAAIYVGQSDGAVIEFNTVEDSVIGIEIENTSNAVVRKNQIKGNTAGIFVVVLPGLNIPFSENVLIEDNLVRENNRENTAGGGNLALLPEGTGILNIGGDNVVIQHNNVRRNNSLGIASIGNPFFLFDGRIEPFVDGLEVRDNLLVQNGNSPDPDRALTPGADIVFVPDVINPFAGGTLILPDPDPFDSCFDDNNYRTEFVQVNVLPGATLDDFPCP